MPCGFPVTGLVARPEIVADLLMTAVFPEDKVTAHIERRRPAQEPSRCAANKASDVFNEMVFRGHPFIGPHRLRSDGQDLTRESLVDFYRRYYALTTRCWRSWETSTRRS
jgi:hypothetical protein